MKKLKRIYEEPCLDVILLSQYDIVTASGEDTGNSGAPDPGDLDDGSKC